MKTLVKHIQYYVCETCNFTNTDKELVLICEANHKIVNCQHEYNYTFISSFDTYIKVKKHCRHCCNEENSVNGDKLSRKNNHEIAKMVYDFIKDNK